MRLTPPKKITFYISVLLMIVGLVLNFTGQAAIGFWLVLAGGAILAAGNAIKGF